ncbi:lipoprotein [Williamsoniiplasma lucivorax]|uniref:Lipoprotein n=1 Tax=Williamsoniiplasma lucivorax TaxID=209274 RepID=A0A2S5REQ3_9MOLU|nr:lipoprotein [Williamsoniiplasma lucivorax]PPE05791.1 hypothetical protein ELUCI_v1c00790 [Williamsoniiplasma lucivorax]
MRKLLALLGSMGVTAGSVSTVIACNGEQTNPKIKELQTEIKNIKKLISEKDPTETSPRTQEFKKFLGQIPKIETNLQINNSLERLKSAKAEYLKNLESDYADSIMGNKPSFKPEIISPPSEVISPPVILNQPTRPLKPAKAKGETTEQKTKRIKSLINTKMELLSTKEFLFDNDVIFEHQNQLEIIKNTIKTQIIEELKNIKGIDLDKLNMQLFDNEFVVLVTTDLIRAGSIKLSIQYNDEECRATPWTLSYNSHYFSEYRTFNQILSNSRNLNITDLGLPQGLGLPDMISNASIGGVITFLPLVLDPILSELSTSFEEVDGLDIYQQSQGFIDSLKSLGLHDLPALNKEINLNISKELSAVLKIKAEINDLIRALIPFIINFRNFVAEQQHKDLVVNFLSYLTSKPKSYNGDKFDVFLEKREVSFNTNIEMLMSALLDNLSSKEDNIIAKSPLKIELSIPKINKTIHVGFEEKQDTLQTIGIKEMIDFPHFIAQLNNLASFDKNGVMKIKMRINFKVMGKEFPVEMPFDLPINKMINQQTIVPMIEKMASRSLTNLKIEIVDYSAKTQMLVNGAWVNFDIANIAQAAKLRVVVKYLSTKITDHKGNFLIEHDHHKFVDTNALTIDFGIDSSFIATPRKQKTPEQIEQDQRELAEAKARNAEKKTSRELAKFDQLDKQRVVFPHLVLKNDDNKLRELILQEVQKFARREAKSLDTSKLEVRVLKREFPKNEQNGLAEIEIKYDNKLARSKAYTIYFGSSYFDKSQAIINALHEGIDMSTSDMQILKNLPIIGDLTIGNILELAPIMDKNLLSTLPTKLPTNPAENTDFSNKVATWIDSIKKLNLLDWDKVIEKDLIPQNKWTKYFSVKLLIKTTPKDILRGLIPLLINFRNFVNQEQEKDLVLSFVKYLLSKPQAYGDDRFDQMINKNGDDIDTNLKFLVLSLFDGARFSNGETWWDAKPPVELVLETFIKNMPIKYSVQWHWLINTPGLKDILYLDQFKNLVDSLGTLKENSAFWWNLYIKVGFIPINTSIEVPINKLINGDILMPFLASALKIDLADELKIKVKKYEANILVLVNNKWEILNGVNVLTAAQMKLTFNKIELEITDKNNQNSRTINFSSKNDKPVLNILFDINAKKVISIIK